MVFPREQMFECSDGDQFKNIGTNEVFVLFQPSLVKGDDYTRDKNEKLISFSLTVDCWNLGECLSQWDTTSCSKTVSDVLKAAVMLSKSDAYRIQSLMLLCTNNYFFLLLSCKLGLKGLPYFLCVNDLWKQDSIAGSLDAAVHEDFPFASYKFTAFASKIHYYTIYISATSWIKARRRHHFARLQKLLGVNNLHSFGSSSIPEAALQDSSGPHDPALPRVCTGTPKLCKALLPLYAKQWFGSCSANSFIFLFCMGKYETKAA